MNSHQGRLLYRTHRLAVARTLGVDEVYVWPQILDELATRSASVAELLELHSSRSAVPHDSWRQLIASAHEAIDVLAYAGMFLFEQLDFTATVRERRAKACGSACCSQPVLRPQSSATPKRRAQPAALKDASRLHRRYLRDVASLPGDVAAPPVARQVPRSGVSTALTGSTLLGAQVGSVGGPQLRHLGILAAR